MEYAPSKQALEVLLETHKMSPRIAAVPYGIISLAAGTHAAAYGFVVAASVHSGVLFDRPAYIAAGATLTGAAAGFAYLAKQAFQHTNALLSIEEGEDIYYIKQLPLTRGGFVKADASARGAAARVVPLDSLEGVAPGQGVFINGVRAHYQGIQREGMRIRHTLHGEFNGKEITGSSPWYLAPTHSMVNRLLRSDSPLYWCGIVQDEGAITVIGEGAAVGAKARPRKKRVKTPKLSFGQRPILEV